MIGDQTAILSLQNGVDNPRQNRSPILGIATELLAGVVYVGAQVSRPGVIQHSVRRQDCFRPDGRRRGDAAKIVEQTLAAAAIPCAISADIEKVQWAKLLWNAPFCAISCLTRATVRRSSSPKRSPNSPSIAWRKCKPRRAPAASISADRALRRNTAFFQGLGAISNHRCCKIWKQESRSNTKPSTALSLSLLQRAGKASADQ